MILGAYISFAVIGKKIIEGYAQYLADSVELIKINMPYARFYLGYRSSREIIAVHLQLCGKLILRQHTLLAKGADALTYESVI